MNLEEYFRMNLKMGTIDHELRVQINGRGKYQFYIHPVRVAGETLDFEVDGNVLREMGDVSIDFDVVSTNDSAVIEVKTSKSPEENRK